MALAEKLENKRFAPASMPPKESLPTMYDLPSEDPQEPGLPDEFHHYQPQLLRETFKPPVCERDRIFIGTDIHLYYDPYHTLWYKRPDWFAVVDHSRFYFNGDLRYSYVIWQEQVVPFCVVELLSPGTQDEDLGRMPWDNAGPPPKWVVYEQILQVPYYLLYDRKDKVFMAYRWTEGHYQQLPVAQERLWLPEIGLGIGTWEGEFDGFHNKWLRWYDAQGWVLTLAEAREQANQRAAQEKQRAEQAAQRAEQADQRAEQEKQRAAKLAAQLRALGIEPDTD